MNNTKIGKDIPVGKRPVVIAVDRSDSMTYMANSNSSTVSVKDIILR